MSDPVRSGAEKTPPSEVPMMQPPPTAPAVRWRLRDITLDLTTPQVMAICNVTPDSFSDGGEHYTVALALECAEAAFREGAAILDVGGESTRPGATPVPLEIELARVIPVIEAVRDRLPGLLISVDTSKAAVARAAIDAGAHAINDVSAGRLDAEMFHVAASTGAGLVLMHSRGGVAEMATYALAQYESVTNEVRCELSARIAEARAAGVGDAAIVIDPGLGFAKTSTQSLRLLRELGSLAALGFPVLVGASRKRFIGELTGVTAPSRRVVGSSVAHAFAVYHGARIIRTHDVRSTRDAIAVAVGLCAG